MIGHFESQRCRRIGTLLRRQVKLFNGNSVAMRCHDISFPKHAVCALTDADARTMRVMPGRPFIDSSSPLKRIGVIVISNYLSCKINYNMKQIH